MKSLNKFVNALSDLFISQDFFDFWEKLSKRTSYKTKIDAEKLIEDCLQKLQSIKFPDPKIVITKSHFVLSGYNLKLEKTENGAAFFIIKRKTSELKEKHLTARRKQINILLKRVQNLPNLRATMFCEITKFWKL